MEQNSKITVLLLEDIEEHFNTISRMLKNAECELLFDYKNNLELIADYDASVNCTPRAKEVHRKNVENKVSTFKENSDLFYVIDINWSGDTEDKISADHYGLDFFSEYLNNESIKKNTIIVSVVPKETVKTQVKGLKFISKFDDDGTLFPDKFEKDLLKALNVTTPIKFPK